MQPTRKDNGRTPEQPGRNDKQPQRKRGFTPPCPKEDRRAAVDPWKLKGLLPPLSPTEYEELRESIRRDGVLVASIVDSEGNIVDGDHRERACKELGIYCPREVREFSSDAEKLEVAIRLNVNRRHLNGKQRRELIARYLRTDPGINDRHLGDITKTSKNTVADERQRLEATGQIDHLPQRLGRDGKIRPAKHRRIITNTPREAELAGKIIKDLPSSCAGKLLDMTTAARRARRKVSKEAKDRQIIVPTPEEDIRILHGDFQHLELPDASVRLLATDIPYGNQFVSQIPDLAAFASRVLVEGGIFLTYYGHLYLPQLLAGLGQHLNWGWMICSTWDGDATVVHHPCVWSHWKPVVVYSKGKWTHGERFPDVLRVQSREKDWHPWQQVLEEVKLLVGYFSKPGELVCDPCGGSFTTAIACRDLGRRFVGCDVDKESVLKGQARLQEEVPALTAQDMSARLQDRNIEKANGVECDETAVDGIPHAQCPFCGRRFPSD